MSENNNVLKISLHKALKSTEKSLQNVNEPSIIFNLNYSKEIRQEKRENLLTRIENIMIEIHEAKMNGKNFVLEIRDRSRWNNCTFNNIVLLKKDATVRTIDSSNLKSQTFTNIVFLLSKIYKLLQIGGKCTRRELYYQNIEIIKSQRIIDSTINDICTILEVLPWELGIMGTSKGLIAGNLSLKLLDGSFIDCHNTRNGVIVPQDIQDIQDINSDAKFILIVEKDAIFQKLLDDKILNNLGPLILITGKGFPDINTRFLLKRLSLKLRIPIFAMVDADPYGIEIMFTYRFGSLKMSHEGISLAVPTIRWLGLLPKDIDTFIIPKLPLLPTDCNKLTDMLTRPYITNEIREQINILINQKCKTEIEALTSVANYYITDTYLPHKICAQDII
ncbi:meiotic recombination protein SPO11 [Chrysoperla carnea]|uniref:meiotic recombination protein SPO11 n=1 Tax=Chrysoperla carnea TaxID=189513 RepID=UPI001D091B2D|nr:meiotic recombination protein SPO11 [Chrysoperla carnea]